MYGSEKVNRSKITAIGNENTQICKLMFEVVDRGSDTHLQVHEVGGFKRNFLRSGGSDDEIELFTLLPIVL